MKLWKYGPVIFLIVLAFSDAGFAQRQRNPRPAIPNRGKADVLLLTPKQEKAVMEYCKNNYPDRLAEMENIKRTDPERYNRQLSRAFREMRFAEQLKTEDPKRYEQLKEEKRLENKSRILAKKYHETLDETEKTRIEIELKNVLEEAFKYRQMNRNAEIAQLEEKLKELREQNKERMENRDKIIELRLQELLGEQTLSW